MAAQPANAEKDKKPGGKPEQVKVTVSFPLAGQGPFKSDVEPEATAGAVRTEAMEHFGVADDQTSTYSLTHKGDRVEPGTTVGDRADGARGRSSSRSSRSSCRARDG